MLLSRPQGAVHNMSDAMFEEAGECAICDKKFHAFRRKHRCRTCGSAVCGNCARAHKVLPSATIMRYNNEPVRVCDRCLRDQNQMLLERRRAEDVERARARQLAIVEERQAEERRRAQEEAEAQAREKSRRELRLRHLEDAHLGPRPDRATLRRSRSLDDCGRDGHAPASLRARERALFIADAEKRAFDLVAGPVVSAEPLAVVDSEEKPPAVAAAATVVQEAEECALCLEPMDVGNAIYTTECGHSFHWSCLKEIQSSDASNFDKCPSCRATMSEMQVKKQCDHPRVRLGHRFCRDCGTAVSERDAKARPPEAAGGGGVAPTAGGFGVAPPSQQQLPANQPVSYRASSHGALVRCPQCQIQMRVLPHMYNMRVACPSGHMFLVQVAGQQGGGGFGGSARGGYGYGHAPGAGGSLSNGGRLPTRGMAMGYPGSSYYRQTNSYSEL